LTTLDLGGSIVTISGDAVEQLHLITDSVGGGALVIEAGGAIEFDDAAGAGFDESVLDIIINGSADAPVRIEGTLAHPFSMPAAACVMLATRCSFVNYSGAVSSPTWTLNNCRFIAPLTVSPRSAMIARNLHQSVKVEPFTGYDDSGQPIYGNAVVVPCAVSPVTRRERTASGDIHTLVGTLIIFAGDADVSDKDRITLIDHPDREPVVAQVDLCRDSRGRIEHREVRF
jgi:hypothetical protein